MIQTFIRQFCSATAFAATAAVIFAGCASKEAAPVGSKWMVKVDKANFYKYGPAQTFGPDMQLDHGMRVTMIERGWGYTRVMTDNGVTGYVASDELEPAPYEPNPTPGNVVTNWKLPPLLTETNTRGSSSGRRKAGNQPPRQSNVQPTPDHPLFDVADLPVKAPEPGATTTATDAKKPTPKFRFQPKPN